MRKQANIQTGLVGKISILTPNQLKRLKGGDNRETSPSDGERKKDIIIVEDLMY